MRVVFLFLYSKIKDKTIYINSVSTFISAEEGIRNYTNIKEKDRLRIQLGVFISAVKFVDDELDLLNKGTRLYLSR